MFQSDMIYYTHTKRAKVYMDRYKAIDRGLVGVQGVFKRVEPMGTDFFIPGLFHFLN